MGDDLLAAARELQAAWAHRRDGGFMCDLMRELADRIEALTAKKEAAEADVENLARRVDKWFKACEAAEAEVERLTRERDAARLWAQEAILELEALKRALTAKAPPQEDGE